MDNAQVPTRKQPNTRLQHERELNGWSQDYVAEKIGTTAKNVSRWERGDNKPVPYYRDKLIKLFGKNAEELGFLDKITDDKPEEENPEVTIISEKSPPSQSTVSSDLDDNQPIQLFIPNNASHVVTMQIYQQNESGTSVLVDEPLQITAYSYREDATRQAMTLVKSGDDAVNRRDFLRGAKRIAASVIGAEVLDRFYRALKKPSTLDERFLSYLQSHTEAYWRDHYHASLASYDLLDYVGEHFHKIVQLLEGPMLPATRTRLCTTASGTALLIGTLLFDVADYNSSREYFGAAIRAAQESNHHTLQAVGWGWMSLTWTYGGNLQRALDCIQTARCLAMLSDNITVRAWLAAIEAEAQAKLHNDDACRRVLDEAECVKNSEHSEQVHYWTSYDRVQFEGYKGICYRLLYQHEDVRTHTYLTNAQLTLKEALAETDPVVVRLQSVFLSDLASTFIQQREVEEACRLAQQALAVNVPQSQMVVQRVFSLRRELEPWKNLQDVRDLDMHLIPLSKLS